MIDSSVSQRTLKFLFFESQVIESDTTPHLPSPELLFCLWFSPAEGVGLGVGLAVGLFSGSYNKQQTARLGNHQGSENLLALLAMLTDKLDYKTMAKM